MTWDNASTGVPWSNFARGGKFDPTPIGTFARAPANSDRTIDLTSTAKAWQENRANTSAGLPNYGVLLNRVNDALTRNCYVEGSDLICEQDVTTIADKSDPDPAKRPFLQVESYPVAVAGSVVSWPKEGQVTSRHVSLEGRVEDNNITAARFQYQGPAQSEWIDIPLAALKTEGGQAPTSQNVAVTARQTERLVWDLNKTPGGGVDGSVHVRAIYESTTQSGGVSPTVNFKLDRRTPEAGETEPIGPGGVNLLTGDFTDSATDVSVDAWLNDLTVSRTYHSRGSNRRTAELFGPGWESSVEADEGAMPYRGIYNYTEFQQEEVPYDPDDPEAGSEVVKWANHYAVLELSDGSKITFSRTTEPNGTTGPWVVDPTHPGTKLTNVGPDLEVTDSGGNVTAFAPETAGSPQFRPTSYRQAGSTTQTTFEYELVNSKKRIRRAVAAAPPGIDCSQSPTSTRGCRSIRFEWTTVTVGGSPQSRVGAIHMTAWDPATSAMRESQVAAYTYDTQGRLNTVQDPRTPTVAPWRYDYDTSDRLTLITPPGEQPWTLAYTQTAGDDSNRRLKTMSRPHPNGQTATWTVIYDVALAGSGAPYDMAPATVATWGQNNDIPVTATAIFPPDSVPASPPTSWARANVFYLGRLGRAVNEVSPGGLTSTSEHDINANVVRQLTPANRARALTDPSTAAASRRLDTQSRYATNKVDLIETIGPEHQIKLKDDSVVRGRSVTSTDFDEGKPAGLPEQHLPTTIRRYALVAGAGKDYRVTKLGYDNPDGTPRGWQTKQATKTIQDFGGKNLTSWTIQHATYPLVTSSRTPASNGSDARATNNRYYGVADTSGTPACPNAVHADQAGLLCASAPAAQPTSGRQLRTHTYTYNYFTDPLTQDETANGTSRTTTKTFDAAGRPVTEAVTGPGTSVPTTTTTYNPTSGRQYDTSTSAGYVRRTYDNNGRLATYRDATGHTTTYTYDLNGRPTTASYSSGGSQSRGYDAADRVSTLTDSSIGSAITFGYDADGQLTSERLPNGVTGTTTYAEDGDPNRLRWDKVTDCASDCLWADSQAVRNAHDQIVEQHSGKSDQSFTYDDVGRLTDVRDDRRTAGCAIRTYTYDANSNRTASTERKTTTANSCGTGTLNTRTIGIDGADRIEDSGFDYDEMGRITTVPAGRLPGNSALTASYHVDDRVREDIVGTKRQTYTYDPARRIQTQADETASTNTHLYADDTDSPIRDEQTGGAWQRYVSSPQGTLIATVSNIGATYSLRNLHGDIVATAPASGTATAPVDQRENDEFGQLVTGTSSRYGWLGGKQRPTDFDGVMQMGQRTYLPSLGRFLQTDPVNGGSANAYDYANQEPLTTFDLDGRKAFQYNWHGTVSSERYGYFGEFRINISGRRVSASMSITGRGLTVLSSPRITCREEHFPFDNSCGSEGGFRTSFYLRDNANYHSDFSFLFFIPGKNSKFGVVNSSSAQFSCRKGRRGGRACRFN